MIKKYLVWNEFSTSLPIPRDGDSIPVLICWDRAERIYDVFFVEDDGQLWEHGQNPAPANTENVVQNAELWAIIPDSI